MTPITHAQAIEFSIQGITVVSEVDTLYTKELEVDSEVITYYILDDTNEKIDVYNTVWLHQYRSVTLGYF